MHLEEVLANANMVLMSHIILNDILKDIVQMERSIGLSSNIDLKLSMI